MNVAQLVVLGALEQLGRAGGYDIVQELDRKMVHKWLDLKPGSIYHALRQLEKENAIEPVEQTREGRYPTKTLFEITAEGRERFDRLQEEAFLGVFPHFYGFKIALKFNTRRSAAEIERLANRAVEAIDAHLGAMDAYLETLDPESPRREEDAFFIEHDRRLYEVERAWILEAAQRSKLLENEQAGDREIPAKA
ncbi:MAG: PadR family transcriptional regulator [Rubrobacteraceae bacterium]